MRTVTVLGVLSIIASIIVVVYTLRLQRYDNFPNPPRFGGKISVCLSKTRNAVRYIPFPACLVVGSGVQDSASCRAAIEHVGTLANAKATNNNVTQRSSSARLLPEGRKKAQKGESPAIHGRQIIILSPAEIAEIAEMAAHSPIFAEQISVSREQIGRL